MKPVDQDAQLREQIETALVKYRMGVDYGYDVTWMPATVQTPAGNQNVVLYCIVLTRRNPLLGQPPLYHLAQIPHPQPTWQMVDQEVKDGCRQLQELHDKLKTVPATGDLQMRVAGNGRHP